MKHWLWAFLALGLFIVAAPAMAEDHEDGQHCDQGDEHCEDHDDHHGEEH